MTAAARDTRKTTVNTRNTARQSTPRSTSFTPPSLTSPSPSFDMLQASMSNRASYDTAMRSARAKAAHAARRESELAIFGRPATAKERGFLRHFNSYIKNILVPECKADGIEIASVIDRAIERLKTH